MIFSQLLYIFQSEHYDRIRFLKFSYSNFSWWKLSVRGKIEWTLRAKILIFLSVSIFFLDFYYFTFQEIQYYRVIFESEIYWLWLLIFINLVTLYLVIPLHLIIADVLISPLVWFQKKNILKKAKNLIGNSKVISIGITGSYGKTTLKNLLDGILSEKFTVFVVPGNINTDLGIANYLLSHSLKLQNADVLLMEMGAYHRGEIKSICDFVQPHYSFLSAIAPVHLDRFGSMENITKAKFEIVEAAQKKSYINISNSYIKNYVSEVSTSSEIIELDTQSSTGSGTVEFLPEFSGIEFEWNNETFTTQLIAKHIVSSFCFVLPLAKELGVSISQMQKGIKKIKHITHRLQVIKNRQTGVTVIDDSYNGNFDGFVSALETLSRAEKRRIVLTPGIVELGEMQTKVHEDLAQVYIDKKIDVLLLIENSNTKIIQKYFDIHNFTSYKTYKTVFQAHDDLKNILKKGDTILFQNDLPDNYR